MTELEYIKNMPAEELAALLVYPKAGDDADGCFYWYVAYNGEEFDTEEAAVESTITTLQGRHIDALYPDNKP